MTGTPLVRFEGVVKNYAALRPLRLADFTVQAGDRIVLSGLDETAAEMFVLLVTGAAVPDEGRVLIDGRDTREISTDTEWLASLDRFGIVTRRAVLLDGMSVAANLALPLTLSVEPMADDIRARVTREAADVELAVDRVDGPVGKLSESDRLRVHLARAAVSGPQMLILEHPTSPLDQGTESRRFGETLRRLSTDRGFGWIALSEDRAFAEGSGGARLRLDAASGRVEPVSSGWKKWFS